MPLIDRDGVDRANTHSVAGPHSIHPRLKMPVLDCQIPTVVARVGAARVMGDDATLGDAFGFAEVDNSRKRSPAIKRRYRFGGKAAFAIQGECFTRRFFVCGDPGARERTIFDLHQIRPRRPVAIICRGLKKLFEGIVVGDIKVHAIDLVSQFCFDVGAFKLLRIVASLEFFGDRFKRCV